MLISAFLTDIADRYPRATTYTDAQKIRWMNECIGEVSRTISTNKVTDVTTTEDIAIYDFPTGVKPENINSMTMSTDEEDPNQNVYLQTPLRAAGLNDNLKYNCWAKVDEDTFMVYPTPHMDGQTIRIYHQVSPPEYDGADTAEDLNDYLRNDYVQAITYDLISKIALISDDLAVHNNYTLLYNNQITRMKTDKYVKDGKYPSTVNVMKTQSKNRRYGRRTRRSIFLSED